MFKTMFKFRIFLTNRENQSLVVVAKLKHF